MPTTTTDLVGTDVESELEALETAWGIEPQEWEELEDGTVAWYIAYKTAR